MRDSVVRAAKGQDALNKLNNAIKLAKFSQLHVCMLAILPIIQARAMYNNSNTVVGGISTGDPTKYVAVLRGNGQPGSNKVQDGVQFTSNFA